MQMKGESAFSHDLRTFLDANWVEIEHRYFGNSMPEPVDSVRMNYLYTIQAASDIHRGGFITTALALEVADKASGRARAMDFYEGQWDGGKLMSDFRKWVYTETTQKIVFVYGSDDPWTGGAIDDEAAQANANIEKVLNPGGIHNDDFLSKEQFTQEATDQIKAAIQKALK